MSNIKYIAPKNRMPIINAALTHLQLRRRDIMFIPMRKYAGITEYPPFTIHINRRLWDLPGEGMQDFILACAMLNPGPEPVIIGSTDLNEKITVPCQKTKTN